MYKLVIISALWCPSCLILKKSINQLKEDYKNIDFQILDYDFDEEEVQKYNVKDILPVIILKKDDNEISRLIGEKTHEEIIDFLRKNSAI